MSGRNVILRDENRKPLFPVTVSEQVLWEEGEKKINIKQAILEKIGAPWTANAASEMTDKNRIYVYVGKESGYTSGNWYYYNGSNWVSGGIYNTVAVAETDKTLQVDGKAADAKKVGDEIAKIKKDIETLKNLGLHIDEDGDLCQIDEEV